MNAPPPPRKRNARVAPGAVVESEKQASGHRNTRRAAPAALAWSVIIASNRPCLWGNFRTREEAELCVARLQKHGFHARVTERTTP